MAKADSIDKHYEAIVQKLESVITTLEDLIEDPLFLDSIHGEQEMSLDLTLELLDSILVQFTPEEVTAEVSPQFEAESFDAD